MKRFYISLLGFGSAIGGLSILLLTFILSAFNDYHIVVATNHFGEWFLEVGVIVISILLVVYAMIDYVRVGCVK